MTSTYKWLILLVKEDKDSVTSESNNGRVRPESLRKSLGWSLTLASE